MNALVTLHLLGAFLWVAGMLGVARLLAFHAGEPPSARPTLSRLEARFDGFMVWPGVLLVVGAGGAAIRAHGTSWLRLSVWMQAKLVLFALLFLVQLGVSARRRRVASQDPNRALQSAGIGLTTWLVVLLTAGILALSVYRPLVGGG